MKKHIVTMVKIANLYEFLGVITVLFLALFLQFVFHELPCPLCMLQRVGFISIAYGFLLNFRFGFRPSHYAVVLLSAVFTSFVALRQIVLHVVPGTGAYGNPVLGLHLYTWCFIFAMIVIVVSTLLLSVDRQYQAAKNNMFSRGMINFLYGLATLVIVVNIASSVMECGLHVECPDDPVRYELLRLI